MSLAAPTYLYICTELHVQPALPSTSDEMAWRAGRLLLLGRVTASSPIEAVAGQLLVAPPLVIGTLLDVARK